MRIPRTVHVGLGYKVRVILTSLTTMREAIEDDDQELLVDGLWLESLGESPYAGTIYILRTLSAARKRDVFWHELIHAVNDVMAYDKDHTVVGT